MLSPAAVEIVYEAPVKASVYDTEITEQKLSELATGMTHEELAGLVQFIEAIRGRHISCYYLRKEATGLARTIEIDPEGDRIFIHLKTHNVPLLGKGAHKRVTYSILYDPQEPKLVASAIVANNKTTRNEIALLEKFRGSNCIIEPLYIDKHNTKLGEEVFEIITPLYNKGSLRSFVTKNPASIPFDVKIKIAKDILTGACTLNSKGYVSRDNNRGNFLVHEEHGVYSACLGDLGGHTDEVSIAVHKKPFGPSARSGAPDLHKAYFENRLTEEDVLSNNVYSLGRVFHFLYFEKEVPWIATFSKKYPLIAALYSDRSNPEVLREIDCATEEITLYTASRLQELLQKLNCGIISPEEHFEYIIFTMLSTNPQARKSNHYWLQYINDHF